MILLLNDKIIKWSLITGGLANLALWPMIYFGLPHLAEPIVLRYNIFMGINLIGPWLNAFYFPLAGLVIGIFNFFLAKAVYKKEKLASYFLILTALSCQLILVVFLALLLVINS